MDFCRNISVSGGGVPAEFEPEKHHFSPSASANNLDDLFSGNNNVEEGDMNLEWLSIFVEDCLSSSGNCIPPFAPLEKNTKEDPITCASNTKPSPLSKPQKTILHNFSIPCKARSKRPRNPIGTKGRRSHHHYQNDNIHFTSWSNNVLQIPTNYDPPLLQQAYWLAGSELILPKKQELKKQEDDKGTMGVIEEGKEDKERGILGSIGGNTNNYTSSTSNENGDNGGGQFGQKQQQQAARRCTHCLSQRTPQWRAGPLGPKTLCNACGVRYKSGRLLPEYRPAKSPTFVSYKHSNSHKKVLEMRTMSLLSSDSSYYSS